MTKPNSIQAAPSERAATELLLSRSDRPDIVEKYLTDESVILKGNAESVVFPETETQVADLLKDANLRKTPVTVSGAGTGITGSRVPFGGVVLSTEHLTKIINHNSQPLALFKDPGTGMDYELCIAKGDHYAIAPPGISIENLQKAVEREGLFYPIDPTEKTAFLGGTVATNASGAKTFHYGPTRNWIRRVRVVLSNGDVLDIRRGEIISDDRNEFEVTLSSGETKLLRAPSYRMPDVKNAAGYFAAQKMDLIDLFIGCEGTLGVFTEIEISLVDRPERIFECLAFFPTMKDAISFCDEAREIKSRKGCSDLL